HIEGGGESDTLNLQQSNHAFQLTLAAGSDADLLLESIEDIQATAGDGHRLEGDDRENTWEINDQDEGTLNSSLTFVGVDHLLGNGDTDTFKLLNGGRVSGVIDGAGNTEGEDTLDLTQYGDAQLTLTLQTDAESGLRLRNLESISAPTDAGHTLIGADEENTWEITATDEGTLNGMRFVGVANLTGGSDDDTFRLLTEDSLSGVVDGAGREDENTLDLSRLSEAAFSVGSGGQFTRIDYLKGARNKTTLEAPGPDNQWRLDQGQNAGTVTDSEGQALRFTDVTDLQGGNEGNRFVFDGGWVTGWVKGGEETDRFELDLAPGTQGRLQLDGGNGANQLQVTGGGAGYEAQYRVSQSAGERLVYTDANNSVYEVAFENLARVDDNLTAGTLQVGGTLNAEALTLRNQGYQVEGFTALYFDHKTHLSIAAETNDQLTIAGPQDLAGTLEIHNARVEQPDSDDRIQARQLRLVGIDQFGSQANPIRTVVDQLSADIGTGGLFLNNDGNLRLNRLDTRGPVDLWLAGSLTSDTALVSNQAVNLHSDLGSIRLDGDNRLTGEVTLHANGDIHLSNRESLTLGAVRADRLTLDVEGQLNGQGPLVLNSAFLSAEGDMALAHEDNRLQTVNLSGGGAIDLNNDGALAVNELESAGAVHIRARGLTMNARSTASSLTLDSGPGDLVVHRDLTAETGLHLSGERIEQRGTLASGGELLLEAEKDIVMEAGARTSGQGEAMAYRAGGHLTLAGLDNAEGTVELNAGGEILTAFNGEENGPVNIAAQRLEVQSGTGVTSTSRLITRVGELSVKNQQNRVAITNSGTVRIDRMASNGNVSLRNLKGDIELDSRDGPVFDRQETDALSAGGTINANYRQGTVSIFVDNGNLLALGMPHSHKPDLVGRRGNLIVGGDIGTAARPLVMYFQDNLFIEGLRSWSPEWAFGHPPAKVENQSSLKMSDFDLLMSGADYLVQVEELEDVDPAVFTEVRNYTYDDIAIRLPESQQYE
uniref:hypothetical protein n=1 Tax=Marinimicrobium locisalis TaxID=546022 RepID=UPI003221E0B0